MMKKIYISFIALAVMLVFPVPALPYADGISSRAAVVMDENTGKILYAKNPDLRLPPASTTKLMTAMVALDRVDLKRSVVVSARAAGVAPTKANFLPGETVTVGTLLYAALLKSANDAAVALAEGAAGSEAAFVELMNRKAKAMGLGDTRFINSNGLPGKGQWTTASDLAEIMRHALRYPAIKEVIGTKVTEISTGRGRTLLIENTNKLLWSDSSLLGGKTGYTRRARHCFVCAGQRDNDTVIVALLGTPRREDLWRESEILMERGVGVIEGASAPVVYITKTSETHPVKKVVYKKGPRLKVNGKGKSIGKAKKAAYKHASHKKSKQVKVAKKGKKSGGHKG